MDQRECNCNHEGWPRAVTNIAFAVMLSAFFLSIAWIIVTAIRP